jgi:hypothetical protein
MASQILGGNGTNLLTVTPFGGSANKGDSSVVVALSPNLPINGYDAYQSTASTNARIIKASGAVLTNLVLTNIGSTAAFFKLYNKSTIAVPGTDIPIIVIPIPAASTVTTTFGPMGLYIPAGFTYGITNLIADSDTTAIAAGQVKVYANYG